MCGRFTLHTPEEELRKAFHLENTPPVGLMPRYNIAPSQDIPIVRISEGRPEMVLAHWGLVPHWSKEPKTKYSTINARIESVAEKPTYRDSFKHRRCLIPADGFYEWKLINGKKIPHYVSRPDGEVFAFAGLWDRWEGSDSTLDSCTIIVMSANDVMKTLHDRMPAIITKTNYESWLDSSVTGKDEIMNVLDTAASTELRFYAVSQLVNSPKNENESCIHPAER